jgi:hypothetical protein
MAAPPGLRLGASWLAIGWALGARGSLFVRIEKGLSASLRG